MAALFWLPRALGFLAFAAVVILALVVALALAVLTLPVALLIHFLGNKR